MLVKELDAWDGKDTAFLEKLFRQNEGKHDFLRSLITSCDTRDLQRGATRLIKTNPVFTVTVAILPLEG